MCEISPEYVAASFGVIGAIIGSASTLLANHFSNIHAKKLEALKFKKIKLEDIYETAYKVKTEYSNLTQCALNESLNAFVDNIDKLSIACASRFAV